jgi:hypothetical protein
MRREIAPAHLPVAGLFRRFYLEPDEQFPWIIQPGGSKMARSGRAIMVVLSPDYYGKAINLWLHVRVEGPEQGRVEVVRVSHSYNLLPEWIRLETKVAVVHFDAVTAAIAQEQPNESS